jgi:hypothetical protein
MAQKSGISPDLLSALPSPLVCSLSATSVLMRFRDVQLHKIIANLDDPHHLSTYNPALAVFYKIVDFPDLLHVLQLSWEQKLKLMKRSDKVGSHC